MFFQPCHSWPHGLLSASQGRCVSCAVSSRGRHVGVMTSETLARAGTLGRLVVQEARAGRREGVWWGAGQRRSESGVLAAEPGASVTGPPPPTPAHHLRRVPVVMVRRRPRSRVLPRVGLIHEGRDPLTKGCAYCTKAPPTLSTPDPRPVTPTPRAVHPADAGSHHSDRASPLQQAKAAPSPGRPTPPVS